jgi:hypothetical protein
VQAQKLKEWDRNALVVWKGLQDKQRGRLQQVSLTTRVCVLVSSSGVWWDRWGSPRCL